MSGSRKKRKKNEEKNSVESYIAENAHATSSRISLLDPNSESMKLQNLWSNPVSRPLMLPNFDPLPTAENRQAIAKEATQAYSKWLGNSDEMKSAAPTSPPKPNTDEKAQVIVVDDGSSRRGNQAEEINKALKDQARSLQTRIQILEDTCPAIIALESRMQKPDGKVFDDNHLPTLSSDQEGANGHIRTQISNQREAWRRVVLDALTQNLEVDAKTLMTNMVSTETWPAGMPEEYATLVARQHLVSQLQSSVGNYIYGRQVVMPTPHPAAQLEKDANIGTGWFSNIIAAIRNLCGVTSATVKVQSQATTFFNKMGAHPPATPETKAQQQQPPAPT